jgi:phosphoribosylformimino-5-aminoimidazole carboxamide ribotide isomerase
VTEAVRRFGAEQIAAGIDARGGQVAIHGWLETSTTTAVALGQAMRRRGIAHAVYTDIARDGMLSGANIEETAALARATGLQVIASGGVATLADVTKLKAREGDGIAGVIIGQALYTGAVLLPEAIQVAGEGQAWIRPVPPR